MKNKFFDWNFEPDDDSVTLPGSPIRKLYQGRYDDRGDIDVVEIGHDNIYDEIQSYAPSCDINLILAQYQEGDASVLNRVQGFYADLTAIPDNYPALLNKLQDCRDFFDSLPIDIKTKFGNSYEQFISQSSDADFLSKFIAEKVAPEHSEVINNEQS